MQEVTLILRGDLQRWRAIEALKSYQPDPEHPWQVTFKPWEPQTTQSQRGLWETICRQMADEAGYTPEEMRDLVKVELLGLQTRTLRDGREVEVVPTSTDLKRYGFSKLIDGTLRLASEWLGLVIVLPDR